MSFPVNHFDGTAASGIARSSPVVVLLAAAVYVLGDPGVKRAVTAAKEVDEPWISAWYFHFDSLAVQFSVSIPTKRWNGYNLPEPQSEGTS